MKSGIKSIYSTLKYLFIYLLLFNSNLFAQIPKNIIFMISDGCGFNHIQAASYFEYGEVGQQIYDTFPVHYFMSTYSAEGDAYSSNQAWSDFNYVKQKATDSAAAATAFATGHKTYDRAIAVDVNKQPLETIVERLEKLGKATGVVTTVPFSHATPAAFVAHNIHRNKYEEIAAEMILRSPIDLIMGAGHPYFDTNGVALDTPSFKYVGGEETWNVLKAGTAGNDADGDGDLDFWQFIDQRADFQKYAIGEAPSRLIGIARVEETLQCQRSNFNIAEPYAAPFIETVPTLAEMVQVALNVLDNNPNGFFLMIEGGAVDWASHANHSGRMIEEEIDFNKATQAVVRWVTEHSSWDSTLVIVTGDHECGYLTGPGSGIPTDGKPGWRPIVNNGTGKLPGMEWHSSGHTNSLIPFFANGAGSEIFLPYADQPDSVRGLYLDNAEVGQALFQLFPLKK